jgi:hypothetical protein
MIQGTPEHVEALILRAPRRPPQASVTGITVSEALGAFTNFVTHPTA